MEQARETLLQQRTEPRAHLRPQEVNPYTHQVCARFPKSIRLGQQEKQVPLIIDQLYSCLRWTGRSAVSVYTHEANGRGDLMLGVKAAQALRLVFGTEGSSANDVALLTAAQAHAKLPELFDGCGLPYVILPGSDSNPKAGPVFAKDRAPEYVLVTPQLAATKALQTSVESAWGCRSMALTEYSKTEAAPLGVPGDALGPCPATAGCALPGGRGGEPRREPEEVRRRRAVAAVLLVHQQERRPLRAGPGGAREGR